MKKKEFIGTLKSKTKKDEDILLVHGIPIELKTKFKTKCAENQVSMKMAIISFMKKYSE